MLRATAILASSAAFVERYTLVVKGEKLLRSSCRTWSLVRISSGRCPLLRE
jgi:hypothetical protein